MKRNRIWPYLGIGAISVLILALMLTVLPAGAATSGSVQGVQGDLSVLTDTAANDGETITWASPDGVSSFVIHLEDSDLDVAKEVKRQYGDEGNTIETCTNADDTLIARDHDQDTDAARTPILDRNGDGRVTSADVDVIFTYDEEVTVGDETFAAGDIVSDDDFEHNVTVLTVSGPDGIINLQCGAGPDYDTSNTIDNGANAGNTTGRLRYSTSAIDTTLFEETDEEGNVEGDDTVTISSQTDRTGVTARLIETSRDSGVLELKIKLCKEGLEPEGEDPVDDCSSSDGRMPDITDERKDKDTDGDDTSEYYTIPADTEDGDEFMVTVQMGPLANSSAQPSDIFTTVEDLERQAERAAVENNPDTTADETVLARTATTERHIDLDVVKVNASTGEVTLAPRQRIGEAAKSVRVASGDGNDSRSTTITTLAEGGFAAFEKGDIIEIREGAAGNETAGTRYRVLERPSTNVLEITNEKEPNGGLADSIPDSGALVVDVGIGFTMNYTTREAFDGDHAGDNDPLKTRKGAMIEVDPDSGDTITVIYNDPKNGRETVTIRVETTRPTIDELSDSSGSAGGDDTPTFFAQVTDEGSGITTSENDDDSIEFVFILVELDGDPSDRFDVLDGPERVKRSDLRDEDAITGGFSVEAEFDDLSSNSEEYEILWWVMAKDIAGNPGVSDNESELDKVSGNPTECAAGIFEIDKGTISRGTVDTAGCDPFKVRVDSADPQVARAVTGNWWDTTAGEGKELKIGSAAMRDRIMVEFNEPMDGDSFDNSDFRVDGKTPADVEWFDADEQGESPNAFCIRCSAFLTLSDPLDPNDEPRVQVVGSVADKAGNTLDEASEEAEDGIATKLTVTVAGTHMAEGSRPVTDKTITITVTSDEPLSGRPQADIRLVDRVGTTDNFGTMTSGRKTLTLAPTRNSQEWEGEVDFGVEGLYSVYVTGTDQGGGVVSMAGVMYSETKTEDEKEVTTGFNKASLKDDAAILFEVDNGIPQPAFIPADESASTEDPNVLIRIDFKDEGHEYSDDMVEAVEAAGDTPAVTAKDAEDFDSYGTVSLVSVTFDGPGYDEQDVTDMFFTRDDVLFSWRPGDLALGEYTVTVTAMDAAGNEIDLTPATFEIVSPAPYALPIDPGVNLISLPGDPVDMDINEVIPTDGTIDLVTTYDPGAALGPWLVAVWNADTGRFEGTLTTIDSMHAYWVRASSPITLEALLQRQAQAGVTPPTISVSAGWNLVPIVDLTQRAQRTEISAAAYFAGVEWSLAYTFDATDSRWVRIPNIPPATADSPDPKGLVRNVEVGKGYWLWATEDGTIVP